MFSEHIPRHVSEEALWHRKVHEIAATAEVIYLGLVAAAGDGTNIAVEHDASFVAAATSALGVVLFAGVIIFDAGRTDSKQKEKASVGAPPHRKGYKGRHRSY